MTIRKCSISECARRVHARGWCRKHYMSWWRHGDPMISGDRFSDPEDAFKSRTTWRNGCLEWTAANDKHGYGVMRIEDKTVKAHRYAWERINEAIPEGREIDHTCHNPACCNIYHLRIADRGQNVSNRSGAQVNNGSSGIRNVYPHYGGWHVKIQKDGKSLHFGTYKTIEEADRVATKKRKELFGEYAGYGTSNEDRNIERQAV